MPREKFKTTLTPFECKPFYNGTNRQTQQPFTIYQIRARNEQGQEIAQYPLRSFEPLELHKPIEVEAQLYDGGQQYGISYTLKPVGGNKVTNTQRIQALERHVAYLEAQLSSIASASNTFIPTFESWDQAQPAREPEPPQQAAPPPAPAPAGPPSPPPPAPTPAQPISAPPQNPPNTQTQVQPSPPPVEPPGGYGSHNQFGGDDDVPF